MKIPDRKVINRLLYFVLAFTASIIPTKASFITRKKGLPVTLASQETAQFTWTFTGTYEVRWGLVNQRDIHPILVSIPTDQQQGSIHWHTSLWPSYSNRVSGSYTLDSQNNKVATFNLSSLQTSLEGLYGCALVSGGSVSDIDFVYLQIRDAPSFTQKPLQAYTFSEGTSQSIRCQANGRLDPQVQWLRLRDGTVMATGASEATLSFSSFSRADSGGYMCVAFNSQKTTTSITKLTALYKPEATNFTSNHFGHTAVEGQQVVLRCTSESHPSSTQKLYFNQNGTSTDLLSFDMSDTEYVINSVNTSQQGIYTCAPYNSQGHGPRRSLFLTVNASPRIYSITRTRSVNERQNFVLSCRATGNPSPSLKWIKEGRVIDTGGSLTIATVKRIDAGTYGCLAENGVGNSDQEFVNITINYGPTLDQYKSSKSQKTWLGKTVELSCFSDGVPIPNIEWWHPNGSVIGTNSNQLNITPSSDGDFGAYSCYMNNGVGNPLSYPIVLHQIRKPWKPAIDEEECEVGARTIRIVWRTPLDNGGSAIFSYVIKLFNENNDIVAVNETRDTAFRYWKLQMKTRYRVELAARNIVNTSQITSWTGTTQIEGKPGTPDVFLGNSEKQDASTHITLLWQKPDENGSMILMYSVYRKRVKTSTNSLAFASDSAWENVVNTTNLGTSLNFTVGEDYFVIVTAWNRFGESKKNTTKAKQIFGKSILRQGSASENSGDSESGIHMIYGFVIAALLIASVLLLVCLTKVCCRSGTARTKGSGLRSSASRIADKSSSRVFTTAVIENKQATESNEVLNKPQSKRQKRYENNIQSSTKQKQRTTGTSDATAPEYQEERHYMPLIHRSNISEKSDTRKQRKDVQSPPGKKVKALDTLRVDLHSKEKTDYMELIPGLRDKNKGPQKGKPGAKDLDTVYMSLVTEKQASEILPEPVDKEKWEIPTVNLLIAEKLAAGKFSEITKGRVRDDNGHEKTVAVKTLKDLLPIYYKKRFMVEMEMMKSLKPHPNVIEFLGHVVSSEPMRIVMEYGEYGDLLTYLRSHRGTDNPYFREGKLEDMIVASKLLQFAKGVAKGMEYISSQNVVHLHLMASSVLVGKDEICKIGNFKLARLADDLEENTEAIKMSVPAKWSAYEAIMFGNYSTQSDIWSYGVILFEIFTVGGCPYPKTTKDALLEMLQKGERIPRPHHLDESIYKLMTDCWLEDPYERPEWQEILDTLCFLEEDHEDHINLKTFDESKYHATDERLSTA